MIRWLRCAPAAAAFFITAPLGAHDLAVRVELHPPLALARALYGGTEPVPFAKVTVQAPGATNVHQAGNADAQGYFAFRPSGAGIWRVTVDDEMGHTQTSTVTIPAPFTSSQPAPPAVSPPSRLERALLGLSLLAGVSGFWYGFRARRA